MEVFNKLFQINTTANKKFVSWLVELEKYT